VNDLDYKAPFPFDGKIDKLTFNLGPVQLTEAEQKQLQEATAKARD
jgi:arylsulfatase